MSAWGGTSGATSTVRGVGRLELIAVCLIAFVLPAFNGRPYRMSSGFVCFPLGAALLANAIGRRRGKIPVPAGAKSTTLLLACWTLAATISTLLNLELETATNLLFGYFAPFCVFLGVVSLKLCQEDYQWVVSALALGVLLRFGYGALVFYGEWGVPPLSELFIARYSLDRMSSYMDATFGNTGNSASMVAVVLPVLVLSLFLVPMKRWLRVLGVGAIVVSVASLLITGSRSALTIATVVLGLSATRLRIRGRLFALAALGAAVYAFTRYVGDDVVERFAAAMTMDASADNSAAERLASVELGLRTLVEHPLGVGPGRARIFNPYDVSHQFAVAQGTELGVVGMATVVLIALRVIVGLFTSITSPVVASPRMAFQFGAFAWVVYAMTANIIVNSGPTMGWVGLLALFLALGCGRSSVPFWDWRRQRVDARHQ